MPLTAESLQLDQQQTEVELQLANEQTMQVPNNTEIRVDAKGQIQIENKAIHSIAQATPSVAVPQENTLRVPRVLSLSFLTLFLAESSSASSSG